MQFTLCAPTLFGLEGIVADELRFEGKLDNVTAENGRVLFTGDAPVLAWANLNLRCAERVLVRVADFSATSFDQLFEGVRAVPWEQFLAPDTAFPVRGHALDSALHSIPDCQKIIKKAIVSRLSAQYHQTWFEEDGPKVQVQFSIMHDRAEIFLDSTGAGLHKRGYRANANAAPLRETLAAAMVKLARWRGREPLYDPFCGSGTIAIEAAMIAQRRAPGLLRTFSAEQWPFLPSDVWRTARGDALARVDPAADCPVFASDLDPACAALARENARKAGVGTAVTVTQADALTLGFSSLTGTLLANPPYGERLLDVESARALYQQLGAAAGRSALKQYILTSDPEFERCFGFAADKKRKLYNGMLRCDLYMYFKPAVSRRPFAAPPARPAAKSKGFVNRAEKGEKPRKQPKQPGIKR